MEPHRIKVKELRNDNGREGIIVKLGSSGLMWVGEGAAAVIAIFVEAVNLVSNGLMG